MVGSVIVIQAEIASALFYGHILFKLGFGKLLAVGTAYRKNVIGLSAEAYKMACALIICEYFGFSASAAHRAYSPVLRLFHSFRKIGNSSASRAVGKVSADGCKLHLARGAVLPDYNRLEHFVKHCLCSFHARVIGSRQRCKVLTSARVSVRKLNASAPVICETDLYKAEHLH